MMKAYERVGKEDWTWNGWKKSNVTFGEQNASKVNKSGQRKDNNVTVQLSHSGQINYSIEIVECPTACGLEQLQNYWKIAIKLPR
jgi:hypothetical protein